MGTDSTIALTNIEGQIVHVEERIVACARDAATELLSVGWDSAPADYELGNFPATDEALAEALGREPTRQECGDLETAIRSALAGRLEGA